MCVLQFPLQMRLLLPRPRQFGLHLSLAARTLSPLLLSACFSGQGFGQRLDFLLHMSLAGQQFQRPFLESRLPGGLLAPECLQFAPCGVQLVFQPFPGLLAFR